MDETPNLRMPYIMPSQAQKHVTHNEAIRSLDALVQLSVVSRTQGEPPAEPVDGERHIVAPEASGVWAGHDGQIAAWQDGAWTFFVPKAGWRSWVQDETAFLVHDGFDWLETSLTIDELQNLALLGIGTTADEQNPLSAKLNTALWTALSQSEGGDGDLRYVLNKEGEEHVLSMLFQSGFLGRAEIGLIGGDDLSMKVSVDGSDWKEALSADRATGAVRFPSGIIHPTTGIETPLFLPAPPADIWRLDASRPASPRTFTIDGVSGDVVTLTTASVAQLYSNSMRNLTMVRIWNMDKDPIESAWVNWNNSATEFTVSDADNVAGWSTGEMIRLGDPSPTGANVLNMIAIDISNYLYNQLGAVFPQKGMVLAIQPSSSDGPASLGFSGTGAGGSAFDGKALSNGTANMMSMPIMTPTPSPISSSNLLFVRELTGAATDLTISFGRVVGIYV